MRAPHRRVRRRARAHAGVECRGPEVNAALTAAARRFKVRIGFVRVPVRGGGVTVGYLEPWRLGVDRFVESRRCASALRRHAGVRGEHRHGHDGRSLKARAGTWAARSCPGPALMVEALLTQTYGIRRRAQGGPRQRSGPFGRSTRDAIREGARLCVGSGDRPAHRGGRAARSAPTAHHPDRRRRGPGTPAPHLSRPLRSRTSCCGVSRRWPSRRSRAGVDLESHPCARVFFALVFLNLAYLAWAYWVTPPPTVPVNEALERLPRLKLVEELPPSQRPDPNAPKAPETAQACIVGRSLPGCEQQRAGGLAPERAGLIRGSAQPRGRCRTGSGCSSGA